jgi:hypothetical protein
MSKHCLTGSPRRQTKQSEEDDHVPLYGEFRQLHDDYM